MSSPCRRRAFRRSVAPLGTALTADQCELLWKMAEEPILCFDGDRAGRKAAFRAIDLALPLIGVGRSLRFALLPEGQDPDDLARGGGSAAIAGVIDAALPLVDLIWQRETEADVLATPERRAALEHRLQALCGEIRDEILRRHYQAEFRDRLGGFVQRTRPRQRGGGFASRDRQQRPERPRVSPRPVRAARAAGLCVAAARRRRRSRALAHFCGRKRRTCRPRSFDFIDIHQSPGTDRRLRRGFGRA